MKRYMVLMPQVIEGYYDVWVLLKETDSVNEAIVAWEATGEEDDAVLVTVVRESLDM